MPIESIHKYIHPRQEFVSNETRKDINIAKYGIYASRGLWHLAAILRPTGERIPTPESKGAHKLGIGDDDVHLSRINHQESGAGE